MPNTNINCQPCPNTISYEALGDIIIDSKKFEPGSVFSKILSRTGKVTITNTNFKPPYIFTEDIRANGDIKISGPIKTDSQIISSSGSVYVENSIIGSLVRSNNIITLTKVEQKPYGMIKSSSGSVIINASNVGEIVANGDITIDKNSGTMGARSISGTVLNMGARRSAANVPNQNTPRQFMPSSPPTPSGNKVNASSASASAAATKHEVSQYSSPALPSETFEILTPDSNYVHLTDNGYLILSPLSILIDSNDFPPGTFFSNINVNGKLYINNRALDNPFYISGNILVEDDLTAIGINKIDDIESKIESKNGCINIENSTIGKRVEAEGDITLSNTKFPDNVELISKNGKAYIDGNEFSSTRIFATSTSANARSEITANQGQNSRSANSINKSKEPESPYTVD